LCPILPPASCILLLASLLPNTHHLCYNVTTIPRRAPLYRWLRFYKHLILNSLRALLALHFDGFMAYEQQVTRDALAYAWKIPTKKRPPRS